MHICRTLVPRPTHLPRPVHLPYTFVPPCTSAKGIYPILHFHPTPLPASGSDCGRQQLQSWRQSGGTCAHPASPASPAQSVRCVADADHRPAAVAADRRRLWPAAMPVETDSTRTSTGTSCLELLQPTGEAPQRIGPRCTLVAGLSVWPAASRRQTRAHGAPDASVRRVASLYSLLAAWCAQWPK